MKKRNDGYIPVSCNRVIEKTGFFKRVLRTRIGSPYVIAGMNQLLGDGAIRVAGFEANGGFLLGSALHNLSALPTRDALLPMISVLVAATQNGQTVADLVAGLPQRFTYSDRLKNIPKEFSQALIVRLASDIEFRIQVFHENGDVTSIDQTDGVRMSFADGQIAHLRASGNAPELRCYTEAATFVQAKELCERTLKRIA